jgi:hypothetical protein
MVIRYFDGSYVEGVINRLEGRTVRAVVAGVDDAVEYTLIQNKWTSESGLVVTFEFPVEKVLDRFRNIPVMMGERDGHCAAGGDCALRRISGASAGQVN